MKALELKRLRPKEALLVIKAAGLRKKYENILIQKYVLDMSIKEIADKEQKEEQTIKNELTKARKVFDSFVDG